VHYQVPMNLRIYTTYIPHVDKLENNSDNNKEIHTTLQMQEQGSHLLHILILQIKRFLCLSSIYFTLIPLQVLIT